jgi:hypothetical protein
MEVRQVQDREPSFVARGAGWQDGQVVAAKPEPPPLDRDPVDGAPEGDRDQERDEDRQHGGQSMANERKGRSARCPRP